MKSLVPIITAASFLAGCSTLQNIKNPLASAYSGFDMDQDGVISQEEAQASPALSSNFNRIDTNRSGGIDESEYAAASANIADLEFGEVDINGDGVISKREAEAMPVSLREKFDTVDADGDLNVSRVEYKAATVNLLQGVDFASLDTDNDGVISATEAEEMPPLSEAYERLDTDADGLVSQDELAAAQQR